MAESLLEPMGKLVAWANEHFDKVKDCRKRFDRANPASGPTRGAKQSLPAKR